ncbi:hypothetical protein U1Q18_037845 [Sarracenia purpurea var. burkii]
MISGVHALWARLVVGLYEEGSCKAVRREFYCQSVNLDPKEEDSQGFCNVRGRSTAASLFRPSVAQAGTGAAVLSSMLFLSFFEYYGVGFCELLGFFGRCR